MSRATRRSGFGLVFAGLVGGAFFWLTDPRTTWTGRAGADIVDAIRQASPGTYVGIAGCAVIAFIGVCLMMRKRA